MKTDYTKEQIKAEMDIYKNTFQTVRLVKPTDTTVHSFFSNNLEDNPDDPCYKVWKRAQRCQNCVSLRAFNDKAVYSKLENLADKIFLVVSKYVKVDNEEFILELISDMTAGFISGENDLSEYIDIIRCQNQKMVLDAATGVYNRRYLEEYKLPSIDTLLEHDLSFAIIDVDHFKYINDNYGHRLGDTILRSIGSYYKLFFNENSFVARYGGDEFIVVDGSSSHEEFCTHMENLYNSFRKTVIQGDGTSIPFTLSTGIASLKEVRNHSLDELFNLADKRLYQAKKLGGNKVQYKE